MTRGEAIKAKCLDCGGVALEVTLCQVLDCPLWKFRTGNLPDTQRHRDRVKRKLDQGNVVYQEFRDYYGFK